MDVFRNALSHAGDRVYSVPGHMAGIYYVFKLCKAVLQVGLTGINI